MIVLNNSSNVKTMHTSKIHLYIFVHNETIYDAMKINSTEPYVNIGLIIPNDFIDCTLIKKN